VSISGDGSRVAFVSTPANIIPGSTDTFDAVFVRDLRTGAVSRVDVSTAGDPPQGISGVALISGDGRHVVFQSYGSGLDPGDVNDDGDVFVRDLDTGVTRMVSVTPAGLSGNGVSGGFAVSADGRYVAFQSYASDLVPGDTNGVPDAFVRDMRTGVTRLVSVAAGGGPADGYGSSPTAVSADGRFVAFQSYASDLVPGDTNGMLDAFVRDMRAGTTTRVSVDGRGAQADGASAGAAMTADARWLAFGSSATNLVPGDTNGVADVFARRR
jgi:Tol biopolymer transport system component